VAGWLYLNLHNAEHNATPAAQAWVIASMRAATRFSVDSDATALANGCSPGMIQDSEVEDAGTLVIGPPGNVNP
jgi:hypothetical protein